MGRREKKVGLPCERENCKRETDTGARDVNGAV